MLMNKLYILTFLFLFIHQLNAQNIRPEILSTTGISSTASSVQVDWTLGELAVTTIQESDIQISQGFHQPTFMVTSIHDIPPEIGQISLYPVPTTSSIKIELTLQQERTIHFHLLNMRGQKIWSEKTQGQHISEEFTLSNVPNGNYFIKISFENTSHSQTFKIIKLN